MNDLSRGEDLAPHAHQAKRLFGLVNGLQLTRIRPVWTPHWYYPFSDFTRGVRSNCDKSQGVFIDFGAASVSFQVDLEKMIALRMVNNLRIQATKATLADLPRCLRCW